MAKNRKSELDALLDEILVDADGDEEQLWALRQALEDNVRVPCDGTIAGEPVSVTKFDYDGNARRGLTATFRRPDGTSHVVSAADVVLADSASQQYLAAYRKWMGIDPAPRVAFRSRAVKPAQPPSKSEVLASNVDVVVLSQSARAARCKILGSDEEVTLRAGHLWTIVPGHIATIKPAKLWTHGRTRYLSGEIESSRLEPEALGLTPLQLHPFGNWNPAEEYWGERGDPIHSRIKKIIRRGKRPQFEMEQILPGGDPDDPWGDPISKSNDKKDAGDYSGAYDILMGLCRADLRCLDAHAHLGNLSFDKRPQDAIRHYEVGVRIGELSFPAGFNGVLPWGLIDNRPFLRCLQGYGLCLWRLEKFEESAAAFDRLLWLNPSDNQGVLGLIDEVIDRRPWQNED